MTERVLFVCRAGRHRSPTAARLYRREGRETDFAGLDAGAERPASPDRLAWATRVFAMEPTLRKKLRAKLRDAGSAAELVAVSVPDVYERDAPDLERALRRALDDWLD